MKKFVTLCTLLVCGFAVSAQRYNIDANHTSVLSKTLRFGVVKVVGRFNVVSGTVNYNPADPAGSNAEIIIKTDSYAANNSGGENAVKGATLLDAAAFPEIKMTVKSLTKKDKSFIVSAALTIHGVTKDVSFPVTINGPLPDLPTGKQSIGISGTLVINRQDYGITMSRKLPSGADVIGNEIEIEINALALAE